MSCCIDTLYNHFNLDSERVMFEWLTTQLGLTSERKLEKSLQQRDKIIDNIEEKDINLLYWAYLMLICRASIKQTIMIMYTDISLDHIHT